MLQLSASYDQNFAFIWNNKTILEQILQNPSIHLTLEKCQESCSELWRTEKVMRHLQEEE